MADYPIFVYGTLLSRHFAHRLISLAKLAGSAQGRLPASACTIGRHPMAVEGAGEVHGEVHWLRPDLLAATLERLDEMKGGNTGGFCCRLTWATGRSKPGPIWAASPWLPASP